MPRSLLEVLCPPADRPRLFSQNSQVCRFGTVERQYRDSSNLGVPSRCKRARSTNTWQRWALDGFEFAAKRSGEDEFRDRVSVLRTALERELASRGRIRISKQTSMFVARR